MGEQTGPNQYLTFELDGEIFALEIGKVREVLDFTAVTRVPRMPTFMRGVINLRGSVVPVVDMRLKFNLPPADRTVNTCIIIVEIEMDGEIVALGALADSVKEVVELGVADIEPAPRIGTRLNTDFIRGMGKREEGFLILLDINRVFSSEELIAVQAADEIPAIS
jgi:purine-binding chemotaxis protein CheW